MLGQVHLPTEVQALFIEMCELGLRSSVVTYTYLLQSYAERGQIEDAEQILTDMIYLSMQSLMLQHMQVSYMLTVNTACMTRCGGLSTG